MKKSDLKNIVISFEKPKTLELSGYEFLIKPPRTKGGGLLDQIVVTKETLSYEDILEFLLESVDSTLSSSTISDAILSMSSAVFTLVWNSASFSLFPDEYKDVLDFIKETEESYYLNSNKLKELIKKDSNAIKIINALIKHKLLRKDGDGNYVVRKKVISNINVSFLQIADK